MSDRLSTEELERARDLGAAMYLNAFVWLMADELGVTEGLNTEGVNAMASLMVEPLNLATELAFRKLMHDDRGVVSTIMRLRRSIDLLEPM